MIAPRVRVLVLMAVLWTAWLAGPGAAFGADAIGIRAARIEASPAADGWEVSADFVLPLPASLREAVSRGVPLHFAVEFELSRPRWYWLDEQVAEATRTYQLSYHALTRQYRVSIEGLGRAFDSLEEALAALGQLRGWRVLGADQVRAGVEYEGRLRMRLDTTRLPKPFQVSALTNRDWSLQSEWTRFRFVP